MSTVNYIYLSYIKQNDHYYRKQNYHYHFKTKYYRGKQVYIFHRKQQIFPQTMGSFLRKQSVIFFYIFYFRYIMAEQKKAEEFGITEDDVSEIRQDINKFRNSEIVFKFNILLK